MLDNHIMILVPRATCLSYPAEPWHEKKVKIAPFHPEDTQWLLFTVYPGFQSNEATRSVSIPQWMRC